MRDPERDWDSWWRRELEHLSPGYDPRVNPFEGLKLIQFAPWFRRHGFRRVLFAGNGITLAPRAFAHCGFDVVALDISSVATEVARGWAPTEREWKFFFQLDEDENVGDFTAAYHRAGGTLKYVTGDFLDPHIEPGPFDLVVCWRAVQHLSWDGVQRFVDVMESRVSRNAVWDVRMQNDQDRWFEVERVLISRGYDINPDPWPSTGHFVQGGVSSG